MPPGRSHPREELVELLWPGVRIEAGRNRLRQTVWVLRSLLEAPGPDATPVLIADRQALRVAPGSVDCDTVGFERLVAEHRFAEAATAYAGDLLPGFYDDWVQDERRRLAALFDRCVAANAPAASAADAPVVPAAQPRGADAVRVPAATGWWPGALPAYLSRSFGIAAQAARLAAAVHDHRFVNLCGAGGAGKTRLAVEVVQALASRRGLAVPAGPGGPCFDAVQFVPLLACHTAREMADAIALALQLRSGPTGDAMEPVVQALGGRPALLVLDNCEQLPAEAAQDLAALLARLPLLHVLVTSRRLLGLEGEREFRIQALELPAVHAAPSEAARTPAVALFVDRARAARDAFRLDDRNTEAVCRLVRALEGVPLAIELAAARVRSHPVTQMLQTLQAADGAGTPVLDLLSRSGPAGSGGRRHDSLGQVIAWSWQRLTPEQAALLADLSVFHHGCPLEAAAAVAGLEPEVARNRLDELQAQSLLSLHEDDDGGLYVAVNAAVREFAATRADPARAPQLRAALRRWLMAWGQAMPATPSLPAMRREMPNLRAALAGAAADGAGEMAVQIVLALRAALSAVSVPKQVVDAFEAALEVCADQALRCRGLVMLAVLRYELGEHDAARSLAGRALADVPAGDGALRARALHRHAYITWLSTRDNRALGRALDEALALARAHAQHDTEAGVLAVQAMIAGAIDRDYPRNERLHREVFALYQRLGNRHLVNAALFNLAICAFNRRAFAEALERLDAVGAACAGLGNTDLEARASHVRGNTFAALRRWPEAAQAHRDALRLAYASAHLDTLANALMDLPQALAHLRRARPAALLAAFAAQYWQQHLGEPGAGEQRKLRGARRLVARQLGAAARDACAAEGAAMGLPEAVRLALSESRA